MAEVAALTVAVRQEEIAMKLNAATVCAVAAFSGALGATLARGAEDTGGKNMIEGLGVAFIHSPDGEKLAEWYTRNLGLSVAANFPGWTEFKMASGSRFAVDHTSFPRSPVEKQAIVLSFRVDDIQKAVKDMVAKGVRFYPSAEKTIFDVGPSLVATFEDPDGNWVQINQPKK